MDPTNDQRVRPQTAEKNAGASLSRRDLLRAGAAAGAAVTLGDLLEPGQLFAAPPEGIPKKLSNAKYTITFYAQVYGPSQKTASTPHPVHAMAALAAAYHKLHPNITIEFVPNNVGATGSQGFNGWLTAQAAAGRAPDVTWQQWISVNAGQLPKGLFYNLKPFLQRPNHYVRGNKRWIDLMSPYIVEAITAPGGQIYVLDCDYVATGIFYNKALWQRGGITKAPKTYAELIDIHKRLKAKGITPFVMSLATPTVASWWERQVQSQLFQRVRRNINVTHDKFSLSATAYAVGIKQGTFSMKNPVYAEVWKLFKDWSQYWAPGASAIQQPGAGSGASDQTFLITGRAAMMWEGSWAAADLNHSGFAGKWGVFSFPTITKATTKYSSNTYVGDVVGGPNAAFQYFVTTHEGNHSMTADKLAWVIDWLQYISTPQHVSQVTNELASFVPTIKGTHTTNKTIKSLVPVGISGLSIDGIFNAILGAGTDTKALALLQSYINGSESESGFASKFNDLLNSSADAWAKANHINLNKYLKKP